MCVIEFVCVWVCLRVRVWECMGVYLSNTILLCDLCCVLCWSYVYVWMYLGTHKPKQSYPADSPSGPCLLPGISESRLDYISPSRDHLRDKTSEHQATNNVLVSSTRSKGQSTILHFFFFSVTSKINFTRKENITLHDQPTGIRTKHFPYTYKEVVQ